MKRETENGELLKLAYQNCNLECVADVAREGRAVPGVCRSLASWMLGQ